MATLDYPFTHDDGAATLHDYAAAALFSERKPARFWTHCGRYLPDVNENMVPAGMTAHFDRCAKCFTAKES